MTLQKSIIAITCIFTLGLAQAGDKNKLTDEEKKDGFILMFDGKSSKVGR